VPETDLAVNREMDKGGGLDPGSYRPDTAQCFVQGSRFEGRVLRLTPREGVLDVALPHALPAGTLVGMTLPAWRRGPYGVFLYGRSREPEATPGILRVIWEKAVTAGNREDLLWFLSQVFRLEDPALHQEPWGPRKQERWVFLFPPPDGNPAPETRTAVLPEPAGGVLPTPRMEPETRGDPPSTEGSPEEVGEGAPEEDIELEVIPLRLDGTPLEREDRPGPDDASPPAPIEPLWEVPAPLSACLESGGFRLEVSVLAMGRARVQARTTFLPMDPEAPLVLDLRIPTRSGEAKVRYRCALETAEGGRLLLAVREVLEESREGLLDRYLRYLDLHRKG